MFYYGESKSGKKLHMGTYLVSGEDVVEAFCGCSMAAWEQGEKPPSSKVGEYCRNCFRTYAWQIMVVEVGEMARLTASIEELLETPFISIETMKGQIRGLLESLKYNNEEAFTPREPRKAV